MRNVPVTPVLSHRTNERRFITCVNGVFAQQGNGGPSENEWLQLDSVTKRHPSNSGCTHNRETFVI